ncbi:hypothetical protein ACFXO2_40815 [Streptomyces sp. NPDC059152]|uniref:hypothetical protein n=1 Tax=Streptomyces sp. NPDC059152 TaxID=3346742 RepID=UPI0036A0590C
MTASQVAAVRAASPWQDDPYDAVVSLTQFTVPVLALAIAVRMLVWRGPGGPDRAQQTGRAAGAMTVLIGLTAAFEWAAVLVGAHATSRGTWTSVLIGGLTVVSGLTAVVTALLVRGRGPRGASARWQHDWLGDAIAVCDRIPVLRNRVGPRAVAWVRRRAMTVFVGLSALAAVGIAGSLAIGERWTNPLLIAWALAIETTAFLAFCVLSNAVAGFVARPPRTRSRRVAEAAMVAGCVAIQVAMAFRDALWSALGAGAVTSVPALVTGTLGAGLLTSVVTAGLLTALPQHPNPPPVGGTSTSWTSKS